MSINSFAAVVGDNDGAAFITKAEFESLKNDFQSQINRYNSSLDNKIDGAIATYLEGVSVGTQTEMKHQVPNYAAMRWIKDFFLYGNKRTFSGNETYTDTTGKWFYPPHDKRIAIRENGTIYWTALASSWWWMPICVQGVVVVDGSQPVSTGGSYWNPASEGTYANNLLLFVTGDYVNKKSYVSTSEPWQVVTGISNFLSSFRAATTNYGDDLYYTRKMADGSITENTTAASGKLFGYNIGYKTSATGANAGSIGVIHTTKNTPWPAFNGNSSHESAFGATWQQTKISSTTTASVISALVSAGVNSVNLVSSTKNAQVALMRYFMFGKNNDLLVNVYEEDSELKKIGYDVPVTSDSTFVASKFKLMQGFIGQYRGAFEANKDQNVTFTTPLTVSLSLPLFPQRKLYTQNSNSFEYNNLYLKYGQGLPLTTLLNENCDVRLKFDYKIYNILTDAEYTTTRKIALSVKNGDYLDINNIKTTDFLSGQINGATTGSLLNEKSITTTNGKVDVLMEGVKKDQQLWLRLYPDVDTDTNKYYAKISNLQVITITN